MQNLTAITIEEAKARLQEIENILPTTPLFSKAKLQTEKQELRRIIAQGEQSVFDF